jgi:hypothetical protein
MLEKLIKKSKKSLEDMLPPKDAPKHALKTMAPKKEKKDKEVEVEIELLLNSAKKKK